MNRKIIKIFTDLIGRSQINNIPNWGKKKILNSLGPETKIELVTSINSIEECEIYFGDLIEADHVRRMPNLKWIHFSSTGVNRAFIPEIINSSIKVSYSPNAFTNSVVVLTLGYICTFARGLNNLYKLRDQGQLSRSSFDQYSNNLTDLNGDQILIVGYGRIGKKLGRILSLLGTHISVVKNDKNKGIDDFIENVFSLDQLEIAVKNKSFVINLLPLTKNTFEIFDKKIFKSMDKKTFFLNLGRGQTVNEKSLIYYLKNKYIAGAALDVFYNEPLSSNSELLILDNTLLSPHVGNINSNYWKYEIKLFTDNLKLFSKGKELIDRVDFKKGY